MKTLVPGSSEKFSSLGLNSSVTYCADKQAHKLYHQSIQELIDHIDVYETESVGKNRTQRVAVYYRFVGYIEIPKVPKRRRENYVADTRQGVSVEYVPQIASVATA